VMGKSATVGLVNNGVEEHKGGELQQTAYKLLKESGLPFVGNIEARQIPHGDADVVVTDGFTGNVVLKLTEGTADVLMGKIKNIFTTNWRTKLAAALVMPYMKELKKMMDTAEYGGAPVLGLAKPVIKAHGNSKAYAFQNAIRVAGEFAAAGVIEGITESVREKE